MSGARAGPAIRRGVRRPACRRRFWRAAPRGGAAREGSGEEVANHFPVDVGEAEVSAAGEVGEVGVVEAEEVEDRGPEVVNRGGFVDDVIAEVVVAP